MRRYPPEGTDYGDWCRLSGIELEDRYALVFGHLTDDDELRDHFLQAETRLAHAYLLVKHLDDCRAFADEVIFYQRVRKQILKSIPGRRTENDVERAVRDLVDDSVGSEGVVDIFKAAGIENPDISILDDQFLQTFKDKPLENLRLKLLQKLLADKIKGPPGPQPRESPKLPGALAEELARIRRSEPILARPAGALLRLRRWARRSPVLFVAIGGALPGLSLALLWTVYLLAREERAIDYALGRHLGERAIALLDEDPSASLVLCIEAPSKVPSPSGPPHCWQVSIRWRIPALPDVGSTVGTGFARLRYETASTTS